jgi:hypothetical protein
MRYIAARIRPNGKPVVGMTDVLVREYASDTNARRYMHQHLRAPHFTPGQYELRQWPHDTFGEGPVAGTLYRLV